MFVWLLHFKGFFLYALLFYIKNVGCGSLFTSVHPNIYYRTKKRQRTERHGESAERGRESPFCVQTFSYTGVFKNTPV